MLPSAGMQIADPSPATRAILTVLKGLRREKACFRDVIDKDSVWCTDMSTTTVSVTFWCQNTVWDTLGLAINENGLPGGLRA